MYIHVCINLDIQGEMCKRFKSFKKSSFFGHIFPCFKFIEIVILWVFYTIPVGFTLLWHFWASLLNFLYYMYFVWLRITVEGSVPETHIWSILLIKSVLKWCIHLGRGLYSNLDRYYQMIFDRYALSRPRVGNNSYPSTQCIFQYKKRLLLRCIHHFKSDLINKYGPYAHFGYWTLVSDPDTNKVVLKVWNLCRKSAKTSWSQKGWCNKPTILQFQSVLTREILMLSKRYESTEVDRRIWLHVPSISMVW